MRNGLLPTDQWRLETLGAWCGRYLGTKDLGGDLPLVFEVLGQPRTAERRLGFH